MTGPDPATPVKVPPHFSTKCHRCCRYLDSKRDPIFPGTEPWTYLCEKDKAA